MQVNILLNKRIESNVTWYDLRYISSAGFLRYIVVLMNCVKTRYWTLMENNQCCISDFILLLIKWKYVKYSKIGIFCALVVFSIPTQP